MIVSNSMFPVAKGYSAIADMNRRLEQLQVQLATGKRAQTLSELGNGRITDLTLRSRLSGIGAYGQTITTVGLRLELMNQSITRLDQLEAEVRADVQVGGLDFEGTNLPAAQFLANQRLQEAIDLLNLDVNGRYLFAGNRTEEPPVASFDTMMNGTGGLAGYRQVLSERRDADLGASGLGRVATGLAGTEVSLTEDGVHPFGFKLSSVATTGTTLGLTGPAGSPGALAVDFTTQPVADSEVLIGVTLPDGTERTLTLTATEGPPAKAGDFQIGATAADTAANFQAGLEALLAQTAQTELAAASAYEAAEMFFAGPGETAMRVDGPPYDSATALVAATPADTVAWYTGEDGAVPRATVSAKIDEFSTVEYGVQANETGLTELVRTMAVLAAESVNPTDANAKGFFAAANLRATGRLAESNNALPGSIESIAMDVALAQTAIGRAQERHDQHQVTLETMLHEIEDIPSEEVAVKLVDIQTRLQASYQTTAIVGRLSLVNYLS